MNFIEYKEKVLGGWIGRIIGSHLGAPMEFRPFGLIQKKYCNRGRDEINFYVRPVNPKAVNDDELYEIASLIALEEYGPEITAKELAVKWAELIDPKQYPVEIIGLKNIRKGIYPPECGMEKSGNFYFDAIQGQMSADIWGLITPNCPKITAFYANMCGTLTSEGIGIDGQIFIAVMIANAFRISDISQLITMSLQELPTESEYRIFIEKCCQIYDKQPSWKEARKILVELWHESLHNLRRQTKSFSRRLFLYGFPWIHVLPNAGIIVLSLLYGQNAKDVFGRPLCLGAMMGYDTDCNCGNIGTIVGTILGEKQIPAEWKEPLKNEFHTYVKGYEHWRISELAEHTSQIGIKIIEKRCPNQHIGGI